MSRTRLSARQDIDPMVQAQVDALLTAANHWRKFILQGDRLLEAAQDVVVQTMVAVRNPDVRSGRSNLPNKIRNVERATTAAYDEFKEGRVALYTFAELNDISTRRKSTTKPPTDLGRLDDRELVNDLEHQAEILFNTMRYMLETGASVSRQLRDAAKDLSQGKPVDAQRLVVRGLDFRDQVSKSIYAGMGALVRRVKEIDDRARDAALFASARYDRRDAVVRALLAAASRLESLTTRVTTTDKRGR